MSICPHLISRLVELGAPVLCVDTCTVLDVVRDITRETVTPADVRAGLALLAMAEVGAGLTVLMAEQVSLEIAGNVANVEQEAQAALEKFLVQAHASTMSQGLMEHKDLCKSVIWMGKSAGPGLCWTGGCRLLRWCRTTTAWPVGHSDVSTSRARLRDAVRNR